MATTLSYQHHGSSGRLTPREIQILGLLFEGRSTREVADQLFVSKRTVDFHLCRIFEKLDVSNRVQAIRRAAELGLVSPPNVVAV